MPNQLQIDALTLATVRAAITAQLQPRNVEVSVCGDVAVPEMQDLVLKYLGTVPVKKDGDSGAVRSEGSCGDSAASATTSTTTTAAPLPTLESTPVSLPLHTLGASAQLGVYLPDSQERAMGYLAGPAPNSWGRFGAGDTLHDRFVNYNQGGESMTSAAGDGAGSVGEYCANSGRGHKWKDPVFAHAALLILQEVLTLFSIIYNVLCL